MAFPERRHLFLRCKSALECLSDCGTLIIGQDVDTGAPRLDLARHSGKLFLILFRPGIHLLKDVFGVLIHAANIAFC